jgi:hypothetical protein
MKAADVPLVTRESNGTFKRVSSNELTPRMLGFIAAVAKVWPGIERDAVVIRKRARETQERPTTQRPALGRTDETHI